MVMPTESQTEEPVQEVQAEAPVEEPTQDAPVEETEVPVAPTEGVQTGEIQGQLPLEEQPITIEPPTPLPENAPDIQAKLDELSKMKRNNEEKAWEAQIIKQMQAVDRKAQQQGADPQTAREMAKQYGVSQKQLRDQQNDSINLIQNIQGKEAAALTQFETAVDLNFKHWKALHNRGVSYAMNDRLDEAAQDFSATIRIHPEYANAWFNRAEVFMKQGKMRLMMW